MGELVEWHGRGDRIGQAGCIRWNKAKLQAQHTPLNLCCNILHARQVRRLETADLLDNMIM